MVSCALLLSFIAAAAGPSVSLEPRSARPGDLVLVRVSSATEPQGVGAGRRLRFYRYGKRFEALLPLSLDLKAGNEDIEVKAGGETTHAALQVTAPDFPARELTVASQFVEPPPEVKARAKADKEAFAKAFSQPFGPRVFHGKFAWPRKPVFNARFGDRRVFNGTQDSQHYGTDLAGKLGEPIKAANDGEVVLVRDCYASGNTVVLFHGAELYTVYFHLSATQVKKGQHVRLGALLGKVGKSGRVTGPHLHFGVREGGIYVDPASVMRLAFR